MALVFAVSDSTGTTADLVVRAALSQFESARVEIQRFARVRRKKQVDEIVNQARGCQAIIVHTLVSEELRVHIFTKARACNIATIDLMGPLLARMSELLEAKPSSQPGLFKPFDTENVQRIDAINFAVRHDDGQNLEALPQAEIVLVGVSRTGKTPISIFLANRGWRVANVPISLGVEPPPQLFKLPRRRVVGLMADHRRLAKLRESRVKRLHTLAHGYADPEQICREVAYAFEIFDRRRDWPLVDVTNRSIEESATEIVSLVGKGAPRLHFV